jgi:hypothetical protein
MPLFEMAKDKKASGSKDGEADSPQRPGTSGTENLLITNRQAASEQFAKAQRAEKAYRARKHATAARESYNETKAHFRDGFRHLGQGIAGVFAVIRSIPYLFIEKREDRRRQAESRQRQRHLEQKKKLEEALARDSGDEEEAAKK